MNKIPNIAYCSKPAGDTLDQALISGLKSLSFEVAPWPAKVNKKQAHSVFIFMVRSTWHEDIKQQIHTLISQQQSCFIAASSQLTPLQDAKLAKTMLVMGEDLPVIYPPYDAENLARQLGVNQPAHSSKLLLVDDSPAMLAVIEHFVTDLGYLCHATVSAHEALIKVQEGGFDILLTDYQMDEMNGIDLIEKSRDLYSDIKSVLITGFGDKATVLNAIDIHVDAFLEKPLDIETLCSTLSRLDRIINMREENKRLLVELTESNTLLKEGRDNLNATLESLNEAVLTLDDNFIILSANSALTQLTQHKVESLLGKAFSCLLPENIWPALLQQGHETKNTVNMEGTVTRMDGTEFPANLTFRRSTDILRRAYILVIQDITSQKKMEHHLLSINEELEFKVAQRTKQIEEAKEEAERANQTKSEFLANMSHELRTPMHAIMSFNSLIDKSLDKSQVANTLQEKVMGFTYRISEASKRLLRLINNLLDISKLESGHVELQKDRQDMLAIINNVISELSPLLAEKSININLDCQTDKSESYMDDEKMTQVIYNLLSNAGKFSDENSTIDICVKPSQVNVEVRSSSEYWVPSLQVSVCDHGVGIPDDEITSIFDKFIQSSKTKTGAGGTGLGLAICKQIIDLHRGDIIAKNKEGRGACFIFNIPVAPIDWSKKAKNLGENHER